MDSAHRYLIAYDVADDPRRDRVAKALQRYGDRIQLSVFLVDVKPARLVRLRAVLRSLVDTNVDSVLICSLGPLSHGGATRIEFLGRERPITGDGPLII